MVSSGPSSVYCGDRTAVTYTAQVSQTNGIARFDWTYPSGWTVQGSASGSSITLIPSGSSGGSVSVQAVYTCGGATTLAVPTSAPVNVTLRPELAPPRFTAGNYDLCLNETRRFEVAPVPGASSYEWTVSPGNLSPSGPITTTVPYLDITAPANNSQPDGEVSVVAKATNGCLPSTRATVRFQIGAGEATFSSSASYYGYVCPDGPVSFTVERSKQRGADAYVWYVNEVPDYNHGGSFQITAPSAGNSTYVRVVVTNDCSGSGVLFEFGQAVYGATEIDGMPCQNVRLGTELCTATYPNPADAALTVEQAAGATTTIYNSQGRLMYTARKGKHTATVDTHAWPAGLYYLHTQTNKSMERCRIQIEHR
ncbi:hypothetical protein BEN47_10600 [Hymenobacter lapidarius]|uniref:Uncharacterized protein n=1 Tax=Hymenobacter lapidarius TaxID=1908237 RepID=A0A1G1T9D1_9BACT|nr:T9SS type A sorting domain-containing protein [Hymenobacter lapidarius]OGX87480.1 hypothetical protein BEN47_10600 [Hymenobacter lapidarius]